MDPLTHSLTGVMLARSGLNRLTPRAVPLLLAAANAPDVDMVSLLFGPAAELHWHRHFTHSLAFSPVLAALTAGAIALASRTRLPWARAWFAAWLGVLSHLLIDLTTAYGERVLLPFRADWLHWDVTNVVDFWVWAILLLAVFVPLLGRLVTGEITSGAAPERYPGRGMAIFALALFLVYDLGRMTLHGRAIEMLESRLYNGSAAVRTAAFPGPANPLAWRAVVETGDSWFLSEVNVFEEFRAGDAQVLAKEAPAPEALRAVQRNPEFQELIEFSQYPWWQKAPGGDAEGGSVLRLADLRFGTPQDPLFVCAANLTARIQLEKAECRLGISRDLQRKP